MNENGYLVPANAKKAELIASMFRPIDLTILISTIIISVFLLLVLDSSSTMQLIIACLPMGIGILLVLPIPNYHNTLVLINSILDFYFKDRRKFIWRGWCMMHELEKE